MTFNFFSKTMQTRWFLNAEEKFPIFQVKIFLKTKGEIMTLWSKQILGEISSSSPALQKVLEEALQDEG